MTADTIVLSDQQLAGVAAAKEWFTQQSRAKSLKDDLPKQVFRLRGWAGTGKTTIGINLAQELRVGDRRARVGFAAFTGKAALVMQKKGCVGAQTIHSLIYTPEEVEVIDPKTGEPTGELTVEFVLNEESPLYDLDCLLLDECSMVGEELGRDLLSFGIPILALGDPGQLPPINGAGFFDSGPPDFMLTEIHRQALDNPIIRMSMDIRTGKGCKRGRYGESQVISKKDIDPQMLVSHDQILCGRNATRRQYNHQIRSMLGFDLPNQPMKGEKLICLQNDRKELLLNGGLWTVVSDPRFDGKKYKMKIDSLDGRGNRWVEVYAEFFSNDEETLAKVSKWRTAQFDWAYAMTVHKAQGSQWASGLIFNENYCFRENAVRWLYTAVTRMSDRLTLAV